MKPDLSEILQNLRSIEEDMDVPRNIRAKVKGTIELLTTDGEMELKIDKSLETLGEVADDPTVPQHTRMVVWSLVSQLETQK